MKKIVIYISFVVFSMNGFSQKNLDFPVWLQGIWEIQSDSGSSYEKWTQVSDSLFLGQTFRLFNSDTIVFDTMKLKLADSIIIYEMSASIGNTMVYAGYPLQRPDPSVWKFENSYIDYPLNINYMIMGVDTVYVWTEAKDANVACMDYLMVRFKDE
ncbi:MAG TPA: hypothetical protein PKN32_11570 [Bacteroidales bacterium]|nr:hypothetical protein [Bacteroidales bacterium]